MMGGSSPPNAQAIDGFISLVNVLSDPDGVKKTVAQLAEAKKAHDTSAKVAKDAHAKAIAKAREVDAKVSDLEKREKALQESLARHLEDKASLEAARKTHDALMAAHNQHVQNLHSQISGQNQNMVLALEEEKRKVAELTAALEQERMEVARQASELARRSNDMLAQHTLMQSSVDQQLKEAANKMDEVNSRLSALEKRESLVSAKEADLQLKHSKLRDILS